MSEPNPDQDLRALLHETAEEITPHGSLEDIRSRAAAGRRRWVLPVLAAAAVLAVVVGGVGWLVRDDGGSGGTNVATTPQPAPVDVKVYYVGDGAAGPRVFPEQASVQLAGRSEQVAAVQQALNGTPLDPDYRADGPADIEVTGVSFDGVGSGGLIQVRVDDRAIEDRPAGMSNEQAAMALEALVRTAQDAMGTQADVAFYVDDDQLNQVLGQSGGQLNRGNDDDVLAPVQITSPVNGAKVPAGDLTVSGVASAFEANVNWELMVGGDAVVQQGYATAAECCTLSPYSFVIKDLQPGTYTIVVHDTDESGEGRPVNRDTKEIIVE